MLEIKLKHPLLKDGAEVVMSPCNQMTTVKQVYDDTIDDVIPIVIYAIGENNLSVQVSYRVVFSCTFISS